MDTLPPGSYVSRVLALPPGIGAQVFDACRADRQLRSADPSRWTVPAGPTSTLVLRGDGRRAVAGPTRPWPLRSVPGELRTGRPGGRYAVELELDPWSRAATAIAVRLVGRRRPTARYLESAGAVVDALASELDLRGLLALHPSHAAGTGSRREVALSAWL